MSKTMFNSGEYEIRTAGCITPKCGNNIKQWRSMWGWLKRCSECAARYFATGRLLPLLALACLVSAGYAEAAPIKKELPLDSTTDLAKVFQPMFDVDEDGDPIELPAVSVEMMDRWNEERLACVPIENGTIVSFEYPLPAGVRVKTVARSWSQPGCTGMASEPSENWYLIWVDGHPQKPEVQ